MWTRWTTPNKKIGLNHAGEGSEYTLNSVVLVKEQHEKKILKINL